MIIATMLLLVFCSYMAFKISTSYSNKTSFELLLAFLISFVAMLFVMMPAITSGSYMSTIRAVSSVDELLMLTC